MTLSETLSTESQDWFLMNFKMREWDSLNGDMKGGKDKLKVLNYAMDNQFSMSTNSTV